MFQRRDLPEVVEEVEHEHDLVLHDVLVLDRVDGEPFAVGVKVVRGTAADPPDGRRRPELGL